MLTLPALLGFEAEKLMEGTIAFARMLIGRAPLAMGMAKHIINTCQSVDTETGRILERLGQSFEGRIPVPDLRGHGIENPEALLSLVREAF